MLAEIRTDVQIGEKEMKLGDILGDAVLGALLVAGLVIGVHWFYPADEAALMMRFLPALIPLAVAVSWVCHWIVPSLVRRFRDWTKN